MITLEVTKREPTEKLGGIRAAGDIPGVVYGPKQSAVPFSVSAKVFDKTYKAAGESTIIAISGLGAEMEVLVHQLTFDPVKGGVQHIDMYAIERGKELTTNVALEFVGDAPVEKTGASVTKILHEVEVTCRPSKLPAQIEVDLSVLVNESAQINIKDLKLDADVHVNLDPEDVVVTVSAARADEPETPVDAPDMNTIEVEAKGKAVDESTEKTAE